MFYKYVTTVKLSSSIDKYRKVAFLFATFMKESDSLYIECSRCKAKIDIGNDWKDKTFNITCPECGTHFHFSTSTWKDKLRKSIKKNAVKTYKYAKEKVKNFDEAYSNIAKIENDFDDHLDESRITNEEERNQLKEEFFKHEISKQNHTGTEKAVLHIKHVGAKIKDIGIQYNKADEKLNNMGIDDWSEERLKRQLKCSNYFEEMIIRNKLKNLNNSKCENGDSDW